VTTNKTPATTGGTDIVAQKASVEAAYTALIQGLNTELATVDPFLLGGKTLPRATVLGSLQARIDAAQKTKAAQKAYHLAVESERATALDADALRADLKSYLQGTFGKKSTKLQDFGFTPRKRVKTTAANKATGAAKAKVTKVARGIVGKNKRKLIQAPVPTTPAAAPAATAPTTAPTPAPVTTPVVARAPAGGNGQ
jgi:hypothetical protein